MESAGASLPIRREGASESVGFSCRCIVPFLCVMRRVVSFQMMAGPVAVAADVMRLGA